MIPELGQRTAPNPASTSRSRLDAPDPRPARARDAARSPARPDPDFEPDDPAADPGADFALSLSSASLRLAEERSARAATGSTALPPAPVAAGAHADLPAAPASAPDPAPLDAQTSAAASAPAAPPEAARRGPASRAIEAYREIARAPVGERVRILA